MEGKNEDMHTPRGPEDASNIADEYPSPERQHQDDMLGRDIQHHLDMHERDTTDTDSPGQTDMQTELAKQVAAQAIEAAVARVQVNADRQETEETEACGQVSNGNERNIHMREEPHMSNSEHHPRQPVFPRPRQPFTALSPTNVATSIAGPSTLRRSPLPDTFVRSSALLSANDQIAILRESYARNPNPDRKELERLAAKTGRPWNKIREYFRQRRNKLRGLDQLEKMEEPGRASGWLQITYRSAPVTSQVPQLALYNSYRHRFDPYSSSTPLLETLGNNEALGRKDREVDPEEWERGMEGLVEPLRAGSWLLSSFQSQPGTSGSNITQTDLYTSYAARFSSLLTGVSGTSNGNAHLNGQHGLSDEETELRNHAESLKAFEDAGLGDTQGEEDQLSTVEESDQNEPSPASFPIEPNPLPQAPRESRLLTPVELINLTRMTFPACEPCVDASGRFVIKGLERREGLEPGRKSREGEMFPFALMSEKQPGEEFVKVMKRKLASLHPEGAESRSDGESKRKRDEVLTEEDKELIEGLKRFRGSKLGEQVRDVCVSQ
ncbi:hypothetical protein I314_03657 [Cryptococcus bacillisporus CA1873]|uniref:Homeobox domain-containing protein n=2 Tax=Cryptococcus gattii TaxID=552467 RepID=A0A0D0TKY4_CRYGA|nr:hypothetical protein I312_03471 [Cryptococcus bacillisporus CA1280]KIR60366.1 hypothetical protein I314_03657 [Cryptococcus bacillisporus CA1873]|eukprot:KIR60366.1 hypothetical protein I314_03657 [Cryptococcus gattii CA1873]